MALPNGLAIALISLLQSTLLNVDSETSPVYLATPCDPTPTRRLDDYLPASLVTRQARHSRHLLTPALTISLIMLIAFLASGFVFWLHSGVHLALARTSPSAIKQSKNHESAPPSRAPLSNPNIIDLSDYSDSSDSSMVTVKASTPETWYRYKHSPARDCLSPYYRVAKPKRLSAPCPKRKPLFDVFGPLQHLTGDTVLTELGTPPRTNIRAMAIPSPTRQAAFSPTGIHLSPRSPLSNRKIKTSGSVRSSSGSTASPLQMFTNTDPKLSKHATASLETTLREECDRLRSELENANSDRDFTLREYDQLLRDLRDREERLNNSGRELQRRDKMIRQLQQEVDGYPGKVKALECNLAQERDDKKTELNRWKRQYESQKAENVALKILVGDTRRSITYKDELIQSLSRELEHCAPKVKLQDIQLTDAMRELEEALNDLAEAKADNRRLIQSENDIDRTTFRTISKLESDLESAQRDYKVHVQALEKEITKLQVLLHERHAYIQTMMSDEEEPTVYSSMHGGLARPLNRHRFSRSQ
ncbi:hypothetical protein FRB95_006132 [Tulasnella sp. JGI-2019a]|nr:hypothetical protein FRB95_006132 [Tulasnella sp. JGI-2019a]